MTSRIEMIANLGKKLQQEVADLKKKNELLGVGNRDALKEASRMTGKLFDAESESKALKDKFQNLMEYTIDLAALGPHCPGELGLQEYEDIGKCPLNSKPGTHTYEQKCELCRECWVWAFEQEGAF